MNGYALHDLTDVYGVIDYRLDKDRNTIIVRIGLESDRSRERIADIFKAAHVWKREYRIEHVTDPALIVNAQKMTEGAIARSNALIAHLPDFTKIDGCVGIQLPTHDCRAEIFVDPAKPAAEIAVHALMKACGYHDKRGYKLTPREQVLPSHEKNASSRQRNARGRKER